ncbi:MAG: VOC family protein [Steroidobacteraceae bacterium]
MNDRARLSGEAAASIVAGAPEATDAGVFGRVRLGYVLVESERSDAWKRFGVDALGMHIDTTTPDRVVAFRIDAHQRRLVVTPGPAEDVVALGWQVDDQTTLEAIRARLARRGVTLAEGGTASATLRGVERYWHCTGPKRLSFEFYVAPVLAEGALQMATSGFATGAGGMGHLAITSREPAAMQEFWQAIFDARVSDRIEDRLDGIAFDFTFLRLNERHHSVAIAATRGLRMDPIRTRIHHLNLQAASLDDVTAAYERCRALGLRIANAIGQHPNDRELSFYVESPSGFEVELGWNPIVVQDEKGWQTARYRGISLWGHQPMNLDAATRLRRAAQGLMSLARTEYSPFRETR